MGLLTDFFLAPSDRVDQKALAEGPQGLYPTEQWKNVDQIKISTLESIIAGTDYEVAIENLMKSEVGKAQEEGPWCFRLNGAFVNALAGLKDADLRPAVIKWLATEEWEAEGGSEDDTEDFVEMVKSFRKLAQLSLSEHKSMYVWICL